MTYRRKQHLAAIPLLLVFALYGPAVGQDSAPQIVLTDDRTEYDLRTHLEVLNAEGNVWTIDEVTTPPLSDAFQYVRHPRPSGPNVTWVRFRVTNTTSAVRDWILEFSRPGGRHALYFRDTSGQRMTYHVGGHGLSFNSRPLKRRTLAIPLSLLPGETRTYHMSIRIGGGWIPLTFWETEAFAKYDQLAGMLLGIYIGILLALAFYNTAMFFSLRDEAYAWYVAFVLLSVIFAALYFGIAKQYFWPDAAWTWGTFHVFFVVNGLLFACVARFVQVFLNTKALAPIGHRLLGILIGCSLLIAVGMPFGTPVNTIGRSLLAFYPIVGLLSPILIFVLGVSIWRRGYRPARYFLVAWSAMLVGWAMAFTRDLGILPFNTLTMNAFFVGSGIEGILLSFALGDRINTLRREREEQEATAREAERVSRETREQSERKSAFLASMAHELRTPLNAIKGFNNLVLRRSAGVLPDRQKDNLQKVDRASDHLLAMINDLLDLSKIEAGRMDVNVSTFDVRLVILSATDVVSPLVQEGVELRTDIPEDIGQANTDQQRLQQMLINLLSNAVKFTESGEVIVCARLAPLVTFRPSAETLGDTVRERSASADGPQPTAVSPSATELIITVSDTGKGIPADELATLFDEYRQVEGQSESTVQKGTGLGLSISKRFAELLGGTIDVESEIGQGSTFTISIPAVYEQIAEPDT